MSFRLSGGLPWLHARMPAMLLAWLHMRVPAIRSHVASPPRPPPLHVRACAFCSIIGSQEDWRGLVAAICSSRYDPIAPQRPLDHVPKWQGLYLRRLRRDGRWHEAGELLRDVVLRHVGGGAQVGTPRRHGRRAACAVASHGHAVARQRRDLRLRWPGQGQALQRQLRVLHLAFRVEHQGVRRHGPAPALPPHGQPDQV